MPIARLSPSTSFDFDLSRPPGLSQIPSAPIARQIFALHPNAFGALPDASRLADPNDDRTGYGQRGRLTPPT